MMTLKGQKFFQSGGGKRAFQNLLHSLATSVRETDIIGWFQENAIVGVIFTELASPRAAILAGTILERVVAALHQDLSSEEIDSIDISVHVSPMIGIKGNQRHAIH